MCFVLILAGLVSQDTGGAGAPAPEDSGTQPAPKVKKKRQENPQEGPLPDPARVDDLKGRKGKKDKDEEPSLRFRTGMEARYDSNVLRLSERDLRRLDDGTKPEKFRIEEPDDLIWSPWIEAAFVFPLFDIPTTAGLRAQGHLYRTNSIMDYEEYTLFVRHGVLAMEYVFMTDVYRREYRNLDTGEFDSAFYSEHELKLTARLRPIEGIALRPLAGFRVRDYDDPFNHRDSLGYLAGLRASADPADGVEVSLEYEFFRHDSYAEGIQPDTSYQEHALEPGISFTPVKGLELDVRYRFAEREYTTNSSPAVDPGHRDREDDRTEMTLRISWKISKDFSAQGEYKRTRVDADLPSDPDATEEATSWDRNEYLVGITYRF